MHGFGIYYRGLNSYLYYEGVPYLLYGIILGLKNPMLIIKAPTSAFCALGFTVQGLDAGFWTGCLVPGFESYLQDR